MRDDAGGFTIKDAPQEDPWGEPDMSVLRLSRRPPPEFPLHVFGVEWASWITEAADASACPPDYVASTLLSITMRKTLR